MGTKQTVKYTASYDSSNGNAELGFNEIEATSLGAAVDIMTSTMVRCGADAAVAKKKARVVAAIKAKLAKEKNDAVQGQEVGQ